MEPIQARRLTTEDIFVGATDGTLPYLAEDYVYHAEKEDGEGNLIYTDIRIPQFNGKIPAYQKINQSIREEAKRFYEEQMEFAEYIKDASDEWEGSSSGTWVYEYVYADPHYISIVYWKYLCQYWGTDVKCNEYQVRLYSAETGEEIEIWELFHVGKEEALLRLGFALRKIKFDTAYLHDDFELPPRPNYILTDDGIDIFFVENVVTKVFHYEIGYEELEDILR